MLLDLGADVNAQDTLDGRTALMGAAHKGRNDVVELLVQHGADLSLRDIGSRDTINALAGLRFRPSIMRTGSCASAFNRPSHIRKLPRSCAS